MTSEAPIRHVHVVADAFNATQAIFLLDPLAGHLHVTCAECGPTLDDLRALLPAEVPDVLVLSRLISPLALPLIAWAREQGIPVVFQIDDDLLDVPESLGPEKAARYRDPERLRQLREAMEASDVVHASTAPLAERLRGHGIAATIRAGALSCSADPAWIADPFPSAAPVLGYMGTGGHGPDLALVLPVIERLLDAMPPLRFEVFGTVLMPSELGRFGNRVRHHPGVRDYRRFLGRLKAMGWWVGIAPLVDHPFNRCKADIKWLEYGLAGMAVVASDLPVYHRACAGGAGLLAATDEDWMRHLTSLLTDRTRRAALVTAAQRKIATDYRHEAMRAQALEIFALARQIASARSGPGDARLRDSVVATEIEE